MNPWIETIFVILIAAAGVFLGTKASRLPNPWWAYVLAVPILMLAVLITATATSLLDRAVPLFFITAGRAKFVILSFAITFGLTTPLSRLPYKFERIIVSILMAAFVTLFAVLPFLMPALLQNSLASLPTRIDADGLCYQSTKYTCGPAAAVTALTKFGLPAKEGEIAVLARTNPISGTLLWTLCSALNQKYQDQGLQCRYRAFDSIAQLRNAGITLVSIKEATLLDHCVAVLDVSDHFVTIADPVTGMHAMPHRQFEQIWRFSGVTINRTPQKLASEAQKPPFASEPRSPAAF